MPAPARLAPHLSVQSLSKHLQERHIKLTAQQAHSCTCSASPSGATCSASPSGACSASPSGAVALAAHRHLHHRHFHTLLCITLRCRGPCCAPLSAPSPFPHTALVYHCLPHNNVCFRSTCAACGTRHAPHRQGPGTAATCTPPITGESMQLGAPSRPAQSLPAPARLAPTANPSPLTQARWEQQGGLHNTPRGIKLMSRQRPLQCPTRHQAVVRRRACAAHQHSMRTARSSSRMVTRSSRAMAGPAPAFATDVMEEDVG